MSATQLLIDTRGRPTHCSFIVFLKGDRKTGVVRCGKCCEACFKALRIVLALDGMGHLEIRRD